MPLKFELLQAEEHSRYLLRGKTDTVYNLRSLVQKRAMISAFIDASADSFLTAILDVNPDNDTLILDAASSDVINDRVDGTEQLICVTQLDKIKIQFAANRPVRINHEGHTAFRIALPEVLLRLQRREYYRLIASNPHSLSCLIPVSSGGEKRMVSMEATVLDISSGGLAILLPPNEPTLEPETILNDCRLMLPETGPIVTSLRVRNIFRITNRDGSTMLRAGCEFTDLPASMASTIQRYILKAERERNARERIR